MKAHILNTQENKIKRAKSPSTFCPPPPPECREAGLENEWINCHKSRAYQGSRLVNKTTTGSTVITFQKNPHAVENNGNQEIIHEMNLLKQQKTAKCQNKRVIKPQAASPFSGLSGNCVFFLITHRGTQTKRQRKKERSANSFGRSPQILESHRVSLWRCLPSACVRRWNTSGSSDL